MKRYKQVIINGIKTSYIIYEDGSVYNIIKKRFLKQTPDKDGYLRVGIRMPDKTMKTVKVHRLVAIAFIPNNDKLPVVDHIDNDKTNNLVSNLQWVTSEYNSTKAKLDGLYKVGIENGNSKFTEEDIIKICKLYKQGKSTKYIARKVSINRLYIYQIINGKVWTHIVNKILSEEGSTTILTNKDIVKKITVCVNKEILFNSDSYSKAVKFGIRSTAQVGG